MLAETEYSRRKLILLENPPAPAPEARIVILLDGVKGYSVPKSF
jgi:hypothetical protein